MTLENHEGLKTLESFDSLEFANWLKNGFRLINTKEGRLDAFKPFHYFIRTQDSHIIENDVIENLKKIYNALSPKAKAKFHDSLRIAFSKLKKDNDMFYLGQEFLHLSARIASPEGLPEIIKQLEKGALDSLDKKKRKELFANILSTTCGMSKYQETRYDKVPDLIRELKGNPHFEFGYSPMAFIALSRAEPDTFYRHLALLRKDFSRLLKRDGTEDIHITGHRFIHYVGIERLFSNFDEMSFCPQDSNRILNYDNWLIHAVFAVKELERKRKSNTLTLLYQRDGVKKQEYVANKERVKQLDEILNRGL